MAEMLFGLSPTGVRIFSFLAGGVHVGLAGLLTWQLGGRRSAQVLAMTAVLAAPVFLATSNYLSMNSFEPCFWMGSMLVLLRIADGTTGPRAWLIFGLLAGLGIENKHSTVFFLMALLAGVLLSSAAAHLLWSRWCAAGVALLILLALPNLIWQWVHHFPTYEMLNNIAHSDKNIKLPPLAFLAAQVSILLIFAAPLWIGGLAWLAFARKARPWRFVALTYLVFLVMMMALHAKHYYVAPFYPVLFAAGAVALGAVTRPLAVHRVHRRSGPHADRRHRAADAHDSSAGQVQAYRAYTVHFLEGDRAEKYTSPLPQFLSDRFGWPQMVEGFAARYNALPPDVRAHTAIFCRNYGEASAVNVLGPKYGLPTAISGHQNYFYWGWNGYTGESVLTLGGNRENYTDYYAEVIDLGPFDAPWIMDIEHRHYFWLRHRKRTYAADWPEFKFWY